MNEKIMQDLKDVVELCEKLFMLVDLPADVLQCIESQTDQNHKLQYVIRFKSLYFEIMTKIADLSSYWKQSPDLRS